MDQIFHISLIGKIWGTKGNPCIVGIYGKTNLNNCFDFHIRLFFRHPSAVCCPSVRKITQIPDIASQNVTNKSCLVCAISEKYAFWVTLRPQSDRCRRGEAEVRILDFKTTWSEFQKASQTATEWGKAELHILNFKNKHMVRVPQAQSDCYWARQSQATYTHGQSFRNPNCCSQQYSNTSKLAIFGA